MNKEECKYFRDGKCLKDVLHQSDICRLYFFDGCNDQKAKADLGKPKLTLVPMEIMFDIARVREYGNKKYPEGGPDNWKSVEVQRYRDAAFRHFIAYLRDPKGIDEESGLPHRWHLECNLAFLAELEKEL